MKLLLWHFKKKYYERNNLKDSFKIKNIYIRLFCVQNLSLFLVFYSEYTYYYLNWQKKGNAKPTHIIKVHKHGKRRTACFVVVVVLIDILIFCRFTAETFPFVLLPLLGRFYVCKLEQMNIDPDKEVQYLKERASVQDRGRQRESDV